MPHDAPRMMPRMLRIGDFSQLAQISVRTLRLYDEMDLIKPARVDPFTDYRYYTVDQLPRLNRILALKDLGFALEDIKRMLTGSLSAAELQAMLEQRQREIDLQIREEQLRLTRVAERLKQIAHEGEAPPYDVRLKSIDGYAIASMRRTVGQLADMPDTRNAILTALYTALNKHLPPRQAPGPELALYHNTEYSDTDIKMELAVMLEPKTFAAMQAQQIDGLELRTLPPTEAATTVFQGPFPDVANAISTLYGWIGEHGYASSGPMRELHVFGREIDLTRDNYVVTLELQLPVSLA
jgi:DNA-binding transcriptional MerR regulator/effector-binding domain-containing protein